MTDTLIGKPLFDPIPDLRPLEFAYIALLKLSPADSFRVNNQNIYATLRDAIAHEKGEDAQSVQDDCEEFARHGQQREISVHPALANAAEILANFKSEGNKLEEWQACYAKLFTQMNEICNQKRESGGWQPMKTAPKDGTAILLKFKDDLSSYNRRNDDWHETWQGIAFVGRNRGDLGQWAFAAPVGHGGFTDVWFEGWKPISKIEDEASNG